MKKLLLFTFITLTTFVFSAQAEDTHTQTDQSTKPAFLRRKRHGLSTKRTTSLRG